MEVTIIFKIAAVGILVSILSQILKHSGRDEQAFLVSLAGLLIVLFWIVPYIYELFVDIQKTGIYSVYHDGDWNHDPWTGCRETGIPFWNTQTTGKQPSGHAGISYNIDQDDRDHLYRTVFGRYL